MNREPGCARSLHLQAELAACESRVRATAERLRDVRSAATPDRAEEAELLDTLYEAHRRGQAACMALRRFAIEE